VRDFLLHSGIVERFCPPCGGDHVNDEVGDHPLTVDAHLFCAAPTGGGPTWFRYHNLLRTVCAIDWSLSIPGCQTASVARRALVDRPARRSPT
jgi:hypothetical protein